MIQDKHTKDWIMTDAERTELLAIAATLDIPSLAGSHYNLDYWYFRMCPHLAKELCRVLDFNYLNL